jgi:hypothetical protein
MTLKRQGEYIRVMRTHRDTCQANTRRGTRCKGAATAIVTRRPSTFGVDGQVILLCKRHAGEQYLNHGALPPGVSVIRYTLARANIILGTYDAGARYGMALSFGEADHQEMVMGVYTR